MNKKYEVEFNTFLDCVNDAGCINNIMVIGSWAEYLYMKSGIMSDFTPSMQTIDVDFLIPNINQPRNKTNLIEIAKDKGFIYQEDSLQHTSRFIGRDNFEVEFLAAQKGAGDKQLPRTSIGVNAQQLTHLDVLIKHPIKVEYNGLLVIVPEPEAYVVQKMIINHRRGAKAAKDRETISTLLKYINNNRYNEIINTITKKEIKCIEQYEKEFL